MMIFRKFFELVYPLPAGFMMKGLRQKKEERRTRRHKGKTAGRAPPEESCTCKKRMDCGKTDPESECMLTQ